MEDRRVDTMMQEKLQKLDEIKHHEYFANQYKREINKIEKSGTWKLGRFSRWMDQLKSKLVKDKPSRKMYEEMIRENTQLREQLLEQRALLEQQSLYHEDMMSLERMQLLREMKNKGSLLTHFEESLEQYKKYGKDLEETLVQIARLYMHEEPELKKYIYEQILQVLPTEAMPDFMIRIGLEEENMSLSTTASFRASLSKRMRQTQQLQTLPEWELDDKQRAYSFVQQFHIPVPHTDKISYSVDTLPLRQGIVVKPVDGAGGRGVYIIHDEQHIVDVKQSEKIQGWDTLKEHMYKDLAMDAVAEDQWFIEEIVYEDRSKQLAGRDLKFYMFYGKVGLILEIVRYPEMQHCWWDGQLNRLSVGKYDEQLFVGSGVSLEEIEMVEKLSEEIPAPFIRIDFLRSEEGLVFGEFTPKPGNYDEFNDEIDQQLGDDYLFAQAKLEEDLLDGKQFEHFKQYKKQFIMK